MLLGLVSFPLCFISTNRDSCMLPGVSFALAGSMRVAWLPNAVMSFSAPGGALFGQNFLTYLEGEGFGGSESRVFLPTR